MPPTDDNGTDEAPREDTGTPVGGDPETLTPDPDLSREADEGQPIPRMIEGDDFMFEPEAPEAEAAEVDVGVAESGEEGEGSDDEEPYEEMPPGDDFL